VIASNVIFTDDGEGNYNKYYQKIKMFVWDELVNGTAEMVKRV
jgi:hypothetical protein